MNDRTVKAALVATSSLEVTKNVHLPLESVARYLLRMEVQEALMAQYRCLGGCHNVIGRTVLVESQLLDCRVFHGF